MTRMYVSIKDPKYLTTMQKLRLVRKAIMYLMKHLHDGTNGNELSGVVYSDYEHTGAIVRVSLK